MSLLRLDEYHLTYSSFKILVFTDYLTIKKQIFLKSITYEKKIKVYFKTLEVLIFRS